MKKVFFNPDKCECWSCGKTFPYIGTESPMVRNDIWQKIAQDEPEVQYYDRKGETWVGGGYLCKDCMEKRLGRSLKFEDLRDAEINHPIAFNKYVVLRYFPEHADDYRLISIV